MNLILSELQVKDLKIVKEIYDYYITNSTVIFYTNKISLQDLKEIILINHPKYKSYLIKCNDEISGFCYLSQYKKRQAYDRTAEITIHMKPDFTGKGIGTTIMQQLEERAVELGFKVLIGIISGENERSIRLFEKCKFEKCAHFKQVGEKFGRVLDVVAYQKTLNDKR